MGGTSVGIGPDPDDARGKLPDGARALVLPELNPKLPKLPEFKGAVFMMLDHVDEPTVACERRALSGGAMGKGALELPGLRRSRLEPEATAFTSALSEELKPAPPNSAEEDDPSEYFERPANDFAESPGTFVDVWAVSDDAGSLVSLPGRMLLLELEAGPGGCRACEERADEIGIPAAGMPTGSSGIHVPGRLGMNVAPAAAAAACICQNCCAMIIALAASPAGSWPTRPPGPLAAT
mmetsp:Transcript_4548/g.10704  ORF Transcript_4548/g.10704 Transcript_4548/m.10704 type:complete len:237 (-) Transcript_4548:314-1024(-)